MHGFIVKDDLHCFVNRFWRKYPKGLDGTEVKTDQIIIDTGGEGALVTKALNQKYGEEEGKTKISFINELNISNWPHIPSRLGRYSNKIVSEKLHEHLEADALTLQCQILKSKNPYKKHFRIAIINGFGTNLGDALLGMTAMRHTARVLKENLKSFAADFLLGPASAEGNINLVSNEEWVEQILFQSPTLLDFAKYDAYIDYSNFVNSPKFNQMPTIDWHLWWMGLPWEKISENEKRNSLVMPWKPWIDIEQKLRKISGYKVLFNHKASVNLRSFPEEHAIVFLKKILERDKEIKIIMAQPLEIKHPQLYDLSKELVTSDHFSALVSQVNGVIAVDTYAIHVADAASVPCVSLFSSIPKEIYPYYPYNEGIMIPNAEKLKGYRKSKIIDEMWADVKTEYYEAWSKVSVSQVLKSLKTISNKSITTEFKKSIKFIKEVQAPTSMKIKDGIVNLKYDVTPEGFLKFHFRFSEIAKAIVKPGMEILQIGAGQPFLTKELLSLIRGLGKVYLFEPRKPQLAIINSNFSDFIINGLLSVDTAIPMPHNDNITIPQTDPFSEVNALNWGNVRNKIKINTIDIDSIEFDNCKLVIIQPPFDPVSLVQTSHKFLTENKPTIMIGPINKEKIVSFAKLLLNYHYEFWVEQPLKNSGNEDYLCLCFHKDQSVNLKGFKKLNIEN